jgi:NADPH-dependent ferric siderophore reductase
MRPTELAPRRRNRPPPRLVQVDRVQHPTPLVVRVTLTGDALEGLPDPGAASHIKAFFPTADVPLTNLVAPAPVEPGDATDRPRPTNRTYTPRRWDPTHLELDVDFLLHGDGPGATWAAQAKPGDAAAVSAPRGAYAIDPGCTQYVLAGDDSAVPAISTILAALPPSAHADVWLEVQDAAEEQPLDSAAHARLHWLHRWPSDGRPGQLLVEAVRNAALPARDGAVWVACEAGAMREIRAYLLGERGLDRAVVHTPGYWRIGAVNHPDHDLGDD